MTKTNLTRQRNQTKPIERFEKQTETGYQKRSTSINPLPQATLMHYAVKANAKDGSVLGELGVDARVAILITIRLCICHLHDCYYAIKELLVEMISMLWEIRTNPLLLRLSRATSISSSC